MTKRFLAAIIALFLAAAVQAQNYDGRKVWSGNVASQAAALAELPNAAVVSGRSYFITQITVQSTTATSGTFALQSGTGTACGTNTTALFPSSGTSARFNAPPTTAGAVTISFNPPIPVTQGHAVCLIGVATNTINAEVRGFYSP